MSRPKSYLMHRAALGLVLGSAVALAGCGAASDEPPSVVDAPPQDAQPGCHVSISFEPSPVIAGPDTVVRATADVDSGFGVQTFAWSVARAGVQVPTELAQADGSAIAFPAQLPGVYDVRVDVSGPGGCPAALTALTVLAEGANASQLRLHVTPPASAAAPPLDKRIVVLGGGDVALNTVALDRGVVATGAVVAGATPVPAYLRFMPAAAKDAAVDAFSDLAGAFSVRVVDQPHDVLVVPAIPGYAPALVEDWLPFGQNLAITAGTPVHGVVRDPAGAPLANAKVQLSIDGLPSTLATTAANGAFTVHARPVAGATITVDVAPPEGRGLPRLVASSTELALAQSLDISYAPLAIRDLAGAIVRRQGSPLAGTRVIVVGSLPAAGTVTTGASSASATGTLRVATSASATGELPSTLAPARVLSAVVEVSASELAIAALDLTTAAPASIDAPPGEPIETRLTTFDGVPLPGAVLEAVPIGALALAGALAPLRVVAGADGAVAATLSAGGHYELRLRDPAGRAAPAIVVDATAPEIAASYALRKPLYLRGRLAITGEPSPLAGAAVQLRCSQCTGIARERPLAEAVSRTTGEFVLVVADPGTSQ